MNSHPPSLILRGSYFFTSRIYHASWFSWLHSMDRYISRGTVFWDYPDMLTNRQGHANKPSSTSSGSHCWLSIIYFYYVAIEGNDPQSPIKSRDWENKMCASSTSKTSLTTTSCWGPPGRRSFNRTSPYPMALRATRPAKSWISPLFSLSVLRVSYEILQIFAKCGRLWRSSSSASIGHLRRYLSCNSFKLTLYAS